MEKITFNESNCEAYEDGYYDGFSNQGERSSHKSYLEGYRDGEENREILIVKLNRKVKT